MRIGLAQLRELKRNREMCLDRAIRKLSDLERHTLQSMLDKIDFVNQDKSTGMKTSQQQQGLGLLLVLLPVVSHQAVAEVSRRGKL